MKRFQAFTGVLLPLIFSFFFTGNAYAQKDDPAISVVQKKQVVDTVLSLLKNNYIFPGKVALMDSAIRKYMAAGRYLDCTTVSAFLKSLNTDLETLSNDRHVDVFYDPVRVRQIEAEKKSSSTAPSDDPAFIKRASYENYMVRKAERMEGNLGYLKMDLFVDIRLSKSTLVAAMNFLSHSDALIIDLRQNGGGYANAVNFLTAYFLPDSTLVSRFASRLTRSTSLIYTERDEQIKKFSRSVPLYILVSKRTSSAAEAFAYQLQAFKRAIVVGDTTNGEANPGYAFPINPDMWLMIPTSVNTNAVTGTNWQGIGVVPDILIKSEWALYAAQSLGYKQLAAKAETPKIKKLYEWMSLSFEGRAYPVSLSEKALRLYMGSYADGRKIIWDEPALFYQRGTGSKRKLIPLSSTLFELEDLSYFRIRFVKDESGKVIALEGIYDDGTVEVSKKELDTVP